MTGNDVNKPVRTVSEQNWSFFKIKLRLALAVFLGAVMAFQIAIAERSTENLVSE